MQSAVDTQAVLIALGLSLFAGLSTGIGSLIAFFAKEANKKLLTLAMGFSAGVMVYISFVELLAGAQRTLAASHGKQLGGLYSVLAFFAGMLLIAAIDRLVPSFENPHEFGGGHSSGHGHGRGSLGGSDGIGQVGFSVEGGAATAVAAPAGRVKLMRVGALTAFALALHNFPEGIATFIGAVKEPGLGVAIAVAVAIHNIPEGIAVSLPVFYATGDRRRAFAYSFFSGVAEPLGALAGFLLLMPFLSETLFGVLFAAIAGIMVFISFDQLLPAAEEYGEHHVAIYGLVSGMALMALSLLVLG
jgi:ZIP family zinc transporter